ncbi:MAG: YbaK/EbsC family protein [Nitrososphaerota archaeon]
MIVRKIMLGTRNLEEYMEKNKIRGEIIHLRPSEARTSISAARAVGCSLGQIAKNILLVGEKNKILVITSGDKKVNLKKVSEIFGGRFRLATPREILEETGYGVGGVPPFGHIKEIKTIIDPSIKRYSFVYTSGGSEDTLMKIDVDELIRACNGEILSVSE